MLGHQARCHPLSPTQSSSPAFCRKIGLRILCSVVGDPLPKARRQVSSTKARPSARCLTWPTPPIDIRTLLMFEIFSSACRCSARLVLRERSGPLKAIRNIPNSLLIKVFFLDLDVKAAGYANTDEAMRELNAKCLRHRSSISHRSSSSRARRSTARQRRIQAFIVYWVLNRALTREEWLPIARALQTALAKHGLIFDPGVAPTSSASCVRWAASTRNTIRSASLRVAFWGSGPDYDPDEFSRPLASFMSSARPLAHDPDREVAADLAELADAVEYRNPRRGDYARGNYDRDARAAFRTRASCHRPAGTAR